MSITRPENEITPAAIREVAQQIAERFHPQKIILFGSYAYGISDEDSDVDLLVVLESAGNTLRAAARISAALDHPLPLDITVFEPAQLEASLQRGGIFVTEVTTNGVILYEA